MTAFHSASEQGPVATNVILVVEDDREIASMLQSILEDLGSYLVILATTASQALTTTSEIRPDLFLFDYRLPDLDGLELYHQLHARKLFAHVPVLFLSAYAPGDLFEKEHLPCMNKPFDLPDLQQKIEALLTG